MRDSLQFDSPALILFVSLPKSATTTPFFLSTAVLCVCIGWTSACMMDDSAFLGPCDCKYHGKNRCVLAGELFQVKPRK